MSLDALWECLALIRRFETRYAREPGGFEAHITGEVAIERERATLCFVERGVATISDGRRLETRNAIAWTREGDAIDLARERFKVFNAVALVRLRAVDATTFESEAAHECADDRYACVVRLRDDAIAIEWTIRGPRKRATVATTYS